jgi:hypothetical protein
MSATSRTDSVTPARAAPAGVPSLDVDPFSNEFFEDPHAIHDTLRGPGRWYGSTDGASTAWRAMPRCMPSSTIP